MIKYFLKSGDEEVDRMFSSYIWDEHGFSTLFEKKFSGKSYGDDLLSLVIMYYIEGKFLINGPENSEVHNYSNKKKEISIAVPVRRNVFHNLGVQERKKFVVDSTINSIRLIEEKFSKKKNADINFKELLSDINKISIQYMAI